MLFTQLNLLQGSGCRAVTSELRGAGLEAGLGPLHTCQVCLALQVPFYPNPQVQGRGGDGPQRQVQLGPSSIMGVVLVWRIKASGVPQSGRIPASIFCLVPAKRHPQRSDTCGAYYPRQTGSVNDKTFITRPPASREYGKMHRTPSSTAAARLYRRSCVRVTLPSLDGVGAAQKPHIANGQQGFSCRCGRGLHFEAQG